MTTTNRGQALLFPEDVAAIWTEENRKLKGRDASTVPVDRVYDFLRWSKPTPTGAKHKHRYENYPMPYPLGTRGRRQPAWHADQEDDLRAFWEDRQPGAQNKETAERRKAEWRANS